MSSYLGPFPKVGTDETLTELKRELAKREECYPDWVRQGRFGLTKKTAAFRIATLRHAITLLEARLPQQQTLAL